MVASGFDHGGHGAAAVGSRMACGGSGRPQRSDWRWVALTTAATVWQWTGLTRRQRAASEIRLAAGGFDHGSHSLHHGGTTSMAMGPDLGPTRLDPGVAVFFYS
jgi:hypothetical protein